MVLLRILFTLTPKYYPHFLKKINSDTVFLTSIPVHFFSLDPICLVLGTLFLSLLVPLITCLAIPTLKFANNVSHHLIIVIDRVSLLEIFILLYLFQGDKLLRSGDVETNPGPASSAFKCLHWNANSLPTLEFARIPAIQTYNSIHDCHLIAITESALKNDIPDEKIKSPATYLSGATSPEATPMEVYSFIIKLT